MKEKKVRGLFLLLLSLLILFSMNCSLLKSKNESDKPLEKISENSIIVFLALDKQAYSPQDAIIATVQIQNISKKTIRIPSLDIKSLSFYRIYKTNNNLYQAFPIYSPKEQLVNFEDLKPNDFRRRQFVFTDCTQTSGEFALQAMYSSSAGEPVEGRPRFNSIPFDYSVSGETIYHRDLKGILLKEDAIKIAEKKLNKPYNKVSADLIINEAGFYDWWITFTLNDSREEVKKAFLVNPYLCVIRKEVMPYVPPPEEDRKKALEELREKALRNKEKPETGTEQNK